MDKVRTDLMTMKFSLGRFARRHAAVVLLAMLWLIVSSTGTALAQTQPFLIQPYFGQEPITSIFDHEYPNYSVNDTLVAYNGARRGPPAGVNNCTNGINGSCYDGHDAIDFGMSYEPVVAAGSGTVLVAGWQTSYRSGASSQLGFFVEIDHGNNFRTRYGHLSAIAVQVGWPVEKGQIIGTSGNTGNSTNAHLHFGVLRLVNGSWRATDPFGWSGGYTDPWQSSTATSSNCLWADGEWANYCGGNKRPIPQPRTNQGIPVHDTIDSTSGFRKGYGGYLYNPCVGVCGGWGEVVKNGQHSHYYTSQSTSGSINRWAEWKPVNLPAGGGVYEVMVYVSSPNATSWQAPYIIAHVDGESSGRIDQAGLSNQWVSLGIYRLNSDSFVRTHDLTAETTTHCSSGVCQVGVDTVQFRETGVVYAPDIRYRDGWRSLLVLRNNGGGPAKTLVKYLNEAGGVVCASSLTLSAHQSVEQYCPSSAVASVVINASQDIAATVLQQRTASPNAIGSYSGVDQPITGTIPVALFQNNNSGWQSELYIQNVGRTAADVSLTFTGVNGAQCTRSENGIPPYGRRRLGTATLGCSADRILSARVSSSSPLVVVSTQYFGDSRFLETEHLAAMQTLYAPLVQNYNSNWVSGIALMSDTWTNVTISYYNPGGGSVCTQPGYTLLPLRPFTQHPVPLGGTSCGAVVNAKFSSGGLLAANVNQLLNNSNAATTYAAVPQLGTVVVLPRLRRNDGWNDGLAISNPTGQSNPVSIIFYNPNGSVAGTQNYTLAGNGSQALFAPTNFNGSALVLASSPVAVIANNHYPPGGGDEIGSYTGRPR